MLAQFDSAIWLLALVQLAGLATAVAARHHQGKQDQNLWQGVFFFCQLLAGVATLSALSIGPGSCTICGAAQAVSVIMVVWEIGGATGLPAH